MDANIPLLSLNDAPEAFLSALSSTGFLHLSLDEAASSALTQDGVDKAFALSAVFYDQVSPEERARFSRDDDGDFNGYSASGSTYLNREGGQQKPDHKEGFGYARYQPGASWTQKLPDKLEERRKELLAFSDGCYDLMLMVLDKLSLAFEMPGDFFRSCHQHKGANSVTILNYPPLAEGEVVTDQDIRAGAHKDWGSVTLLFQEPNGQPGLEVFLGEDRKTKVNGMQLMNDVDLTAGEFHTRRWVLMSMLTNLRSGKWYPAPIIPRTVLINLGLMMEAWTSGHCVATLHRVIFPADAPHKPRRSIAYFGTPDPHVVLRPVKKGEGEIKDANTEAPRVKEFFEERMRRSIVPPDQRRA